MKLSKPLAAGIGLILIIVPVLYLLTLAQSIVFGDPTEYTFVASILGIAHPPGYAFITLLGKLFQSINPFGDIPWRMHLLSAASATLAILFVYGTVVTIAGSRRNTLAVFPALGKIAGLFGGLTVATAADFWQHAIHANPHIITATFLSANLYFLAKWWAGQQGIQVSADNGFTSVRMSQNDRWLYALSLSAGLSITHHPLTVFSFPAYAAFVIWVRPGIWHQWRTLLKMTFFGLVGLSVWLYFPIRSAMGPVFGPHDMNTLNGFLDHVLARGLSESLPFFGLADQPDRAVVFWTLLRLQYSLPTIFLSIIGFAWLVSGKSGQNQRSEETSPSGHDRHPLRNLFLLYGLVLLLNYVFVINLRQQDIMAYLLGAFLLVGMLTGLGVFGLIESLQRRVRLDVSAAALLLAALFLLGPVLQIVRNLPLISLRDYDEGRVYAESVFDWFDGSDEGAVLLHDWEHMTPIWYTQFVEERWPEPSDVRSQFVSTDRPWLESVFDFLPAGPVYLSGYRPEIVEAGFRLRPRGPFFQVIEPGDSSIPPELTTFSEAEAGEIVIVGYELPQQKVIAGDFVPLTLAMSAPSGTEDFYTPVLYVGDPANPIVLEFTTDSHLTTPLWLPGEVIVERFDFALTHDLPVGTYPLILGLRNLTSNQDTDLSLGLGQLEVLAQKNPIPTDHLLANFRQRVGLVSATASTGLFNRQKAPWNEPLNVQPGDTVHVTMEWQSLAPAEESYTIFVHLIDLSNRPLVTLDYTPLGGSTPTHLWIPKWLPGQRMLDPYRLEIPTDLPPGTYQIEVGLYEMTSGRRLHMADPAGNSIGDRFILGAMEVK